MTELEQTAIAQMGPGWDYEGRHRRGFVFERHGDYYVLDPSDIAEWKADLAVKVLPHAVGRSLYLPDLSEALRLPVEAWKSVWKPNSCPIASFLSHHGWSTRYARRHPYWDHVPTDIYVPHGSPFPTEPHHFAFFGQTARGMFSPVETVGSSRTVV